MIRSGSPHTRKIFRRLGLVLAGAVALAACGGGAADTDTSSGGDGSVGSATLRLVAAWPENDPYQNVGLGMLQEEVDKLSDGKMSIEVVGGPESIAPFDLADAVRSGAIDMAWLSAAYYLPALPEASVLDYSQLTAEEERESGAFEYLSDIHHERMNAHLLGRGSVGSTYSMYTTKPVAAVADLAGMRLRVSPVYVPFVEALGAEAVTLPPGEIFTSLERGVINGFTWPFVGISAIQLHEVARYQVLPTYWQTDIVELVNLDIWEGLSEAQQEVLTQAAINVEGRTGEAYEQLRAEELKTLEAAGVKQVEFEGGEAEKYLELSRDSAKSWVQKNVRTDADTLIDKFFT
ncbi:MAG: TRAP transporter substrate-binding protein DctP [Mycobacteriales bacterium]